MLKKILKEVLKSKMSHKKKYYSSSSRRKYSRHHDYYGHKHYKRGYRKSFSSRSFFSS